jgi:type II secretory pathway component GspD/PulD (secretin)
VGGAPGLQTGPATGTGTKSSSLRFFSSRTEAPNVFQSGHLDDIHITPDLRTNSMIVIAPEETMPLVQALIRELDVQPTARAEIKVFGLKKADASAMANMFQSLFLGTGTTAAARPVTTAPAGPTGPVGPAGPAGAAGPAGLPTGGVPTLGTGVPPAVTGAVTGAATGQVRPLILTLEGIPIEVAPLIELRITVDTRTNTLIVAGSANDLNVIEAMISRLEDADIQVRRNEVYRLRNAVAADVAAALNDFLTRSLNVYRSAGEITAFQEVQRDVVIGFEAISNTLLISATPQYFSDVMRIIEALDYQPPQVMIQVLIAEVDLTGTEEFGVELGLQSPVLFNRSIFPSIGLFGNTGTATITTPAAGSGLVQPGVTINSSIQPTAFPGFNFNTTAPLPNNPVEGPGIVGFQGLTNLGTGRVSPITTGVGGFVFQASSNTINVLVRALKTQGRMDILSRPQVMALDNQTAFVQVGQRFPYISASTISALGNVVNTVAYQNIGVILNVTPKINPDGSVLMRVDPQVSSAVPSTVALGNGVNAVAFNVQEVQTTVVAGDGETVALGGLISSMDEKAENKVPWLGDLPYVGTLFRYRSQQKMKRELLVILTPHVVRSRADADRVLAEEARRMDWCLGDVIKTQGTSGMEPLFPPPKFGPGGPPEGPPPGPPAFLPSAPPTTTAPNGMDGREVLPRPRPTTPSPDMSWSPVPPADPKVPVHYTVPLPPPEAVAPGPPVPAGNGMVPPAEARKESSQWNLWRTK